MFTYSWDESLETGHELIDNQHKQLVNALNNLLEACRSGQGKEKVLVTMQFLTSYTVKHFNDEEKLQKKYDYPQYAEHKRRHEEFKVTARHLAERLLRETPSEEMANTVSSVVGGWLLYHIKGDDLRMATFVKNKEKEAAGEK
jgi:hemerythrin